MTLHAPMHTRTLTLCEIGGVRGGHTQLLQNIAQHTRCLWHVPVDAQLSRKKSEVRNNAHAQKTSSSRAFFIVDNSNVTPSVSLSSVYPLSPPLFQVPEWLA